MELSIQQTEAIDFMPNSDKSLVLEAVAGAGKTTTLILMATAIKGKGAFCAFNKVVADDIQTKVDAAGISDRITVGTLHSFGYGAVRRAYPHTSVDGKKLDKIAKQVFTKDSSRFHRFIVKTVDMAKQAGIGAVCPIDSIEDWGLIIDRYDLENLLPDDYPVKKGIEACIKLLNISNSVTKVIDYSDMIYLPILRKLDIWKYDTLFLDEAQDTNTARRMLVRSMLTKNGRLIAVGDGHQAIYGFTGADSDALDCIRKEFNAESLPLTTTFRCPKKVVEVAQTWVSHIQADESAPDGIVDTCVLSELSSLAGSQDAVICRVTKPLVELAYNLIRNGVACKVEGRNIGEGLVKLAKRWKSCRTVGELKTKLESWQSKEIARNREGGNNSRCQAIADQVHTLFVFMEQCGAYDPVSKVVKEIESLFGDTDSTGQKVLTLSTIHKAKGKEWNRVFALGMDKYSPSKWAKKGWEIEQENNLCYVQVTRAKKHLTLISVL